MLVVQANPGFDRFDSMRAPPRNPQTLLADLQPPDPSAGNGYDEFLLALRAEVIEFAKPVVLLHGDSPRAGAAGLLGRGYTEPFAGL
jgi:hypothetical protein